MSTSSPNETRILRVFLIRGLIAIAWAAAFVAVSGWQTSSLTIGVGAAVLLVLYPLIDAAATLIDARSQQGTARQWLLINAASSTVAAIALGVAATQGAVAIFAVFGIWAAVSGAAQLIVVLRRRAQLGNQVPLLLANGVSVIGGAAFLIAAAVGRPMLGMLAVYAATGGVEFVIQAWLLARRRRRMATAPAAPVLSAG
jgi:uncharacterized membrane protein HdeD (DUF308 family)